MPYNVRTLKNHCWQGTERKVGDVYEVDESDACVEGARILGLSERADDAESAQSAPRRRQRNYATRALTAQQ